MRCLRSSIRNASSELPRSTACSPTRPVPNCRQSSRLSDPKPAYPRPSNAIACLRRLQSLRVRTRRCLLKSYASFPLSDTQRWAPERGILARPSLDIVSGGWCLGSHEHRHPPIPSLVAHLLKRWPVRFHFFNRRRSPSQCDGPLRLSCVALPPASFVRGSHEQDSLLPARAQRIPDQRRPRDFARRRAVHRRRQAARRPDRPARPPPRRGAVLGHHGAGPLREFRPRLFRSAAGAGNRRLRLFAFCAECARRGADRVSRRRAARALRRHLREERRRGSPATSFAAPRRSRKTSAPAAPA